MSVSPELTADELAALDDPRAQERWQHAIAVYGLRKLLEHSLVKTIFVSSPAAGADWTVTVPGGSWYEVLAMKANLTTSVTATNRVPRFSATDGSTEYLHIASTGTQPASQTVTWSWAPAGVSATAVNLDGENAVPATGTPLLGGTVFGPNTVNLQVGDQWSAIALLVRDWSALRIRQYTRRLLIDLDAAGGVG